MVNYLPLIRATDRALKYAKFTGLRGTEIRVRNLRELLNEAKDLNERGQDDITEGLNHVREARHRIAHESSDLREHFSIIRGKEHSDNFVVVHVSDKNELMESEMDRTWYLRIVHPILVGSIKLSPLTFIAGLMIGLQSGLSGLLSAVVGAICVVGAWGAAELVKLAEGVESKLMRPHQIINRLEKSVKKIDDALWFIETQLVRENLEPPEPRERSRPLLQPLSQPPHPHE